VTGRAWAWIVLQLVAIASGIWCGVWLVDAVTT